MGELALLLVCHDPVRGKHLSAMAERRLVLRSLKQDSGPCPSLVAAPKQYGMEVAMEGGGL